MTEESRQFAAKTMVFQPGDQTIIWGIPLNTLEIDEHELEEHLACGWYAHPFQARDAHAEEEEHRRQEATEAAEKARLAREAEEEERRLKKELDDAAAAENALRERLILEAEELGLKIDKRWGVKTLQEAIDEAKKAK